MLPWQKSLLNSLGDNKVDMDLHNHIDDLLKWWTAYQANSTDLFNKAIHQRYSFDQLSKQVHQILDTLLFGDKDCFKGAKNSLDQLKQRYRRLMQIYHPDRATCSNEKMHKRAELINAKYSQYKKAIHLSLNPLVSSSLLTASAKHEDECVRFKGAEELVSEYYEKTPSLTPDKLRLRVLFCLLLASLSVIAVLYFDRSHYFAEARSTTSLKIPTKPLLEVENYRQQNVLKQNLESIKVDRLSYLQREEIELFIDKWTEAWSNKDINYYLSFYAHDFTPEKGLNFSEWNAYRRKALANKRYIRVKTIGMEMRQLEKGVEVKFMQYYFSDRWVDKVEKILVLRKDGEEWKIVLEQVNIV